MSDLRDKIVALVADYTFASHGPEGDLRMAQGNVLDYVCDDLRIALKEPEGATAMMPKLPELCVGCFKDIEPGECVACVRGPWAEFHERRLFAHCDHVNQALANLYPEDVPQPNEALARAAAKLPARLGNEYVQASGSDSVTKSEPIPDGKVGCGVTRSNPSATSNVTLPSAYDCKALAAEAEAGYDLSDAVEICGEWDSDDSYSRFRCPYAKPCSRHPEEPTDFMADKSYERCALCGMVGVRHPNGRVERPVSLTKCQHEWQPYDPTDTEALSDERLKGRGEGAAKGMAWMRNLWYERQRELRAWVYEHTLIEQGTNRRVVDQTALLEAIERMPLRPELPTDTREMGDPTAFDTHASAFKLSSLGIPDLVDEGQSSDTATLASTPQDCPNA